jgi:PadR family transcriptional regulator AphA
LLIQVFFAGQLSDEEILEIFRREAEETRSLLERYGQVPDESRAYIEGTNSPRETFFWLLTLECGIRVTQAHLEWLESVIRRIENKEHPSEGG